MMIRPTQRQTLLTGTLLLSTGFGAFLDQTAVAADERQVAIVEQIVGDALLERRGQTERLVVGRPLVRFDRLSTTAHSRVAVAFKDGSRLVLGDNGTISIEDWRPEHGRTAGALLLDHAGGAVRLTAARPLKAPDKRVELRTPAAVVSLRGTDLWSGPMEGATGFIVLAGSVDVRNDAGSVLIDKRNAGTLIRDRNSAPERPRGMAPDQLLRAIASVELGLK